MRLLILNTFVFAGLLAACAPATSGDESATGEDAEMASAEGEGSGLADIEMCDAEDYRSLIGSNIASVTLPSGPMLRAYGVDDIITQEYLPQRTNVVYGPEGKITRVYCG